VKEVDIMKVGDEVKLRVRMSARDVHYGGDLVPGAKALELFGDIVTEITIRQDGDEGLFRAYKEIEFLAPVYAGDYIEYTGKLIKLGATSRTIELIAKKVIASSRDPNTPSAVDVLEEPVVVVKAVGVTVTPKEHQRKTAT
jgi:3-aminobutyryl-CoA ammonia-lyase